MHFHGRCTKRLGSRYCVFLNLLSDLLRSLKVVLVKRFPDQKLYMHFLFLNNAMRSFHRKTVRLDQQYQITYANRSSCFVLFLTQQPNAGQGLLIAEVSRSNTRTRPQSVWLLWTGDRYHAETSTWEQTTFTTDIHAPGGIRTRNPSKRSAVDSRFWPLDPWDRP